MYLRRFFILKSSFIYGIKSIIYLKVLQSDELFINEINNIFYSLNVYQRLLCVFFSCLCTFFHTAFFVDYYEVGRKWEKNIMKVLLLQKSHRWINQKLNITSKYITLCQGRINAKQLADLHFSVSSSRLIDRFDW